MWEQREWCRKSHLLGLVMNDSLVLRNVLLSSHARYEYHWADGTNIKKPIKCSAPKYIDYLMTWVQDQLDDETLFPSKIGNVNKVKLNNVFGLQLYRNIEVL